MTAFSTYAANKIADFTFRATAFSSPSAVWASLYNTEPGIDNSGTELVSAGYARQAISFAAPSGRKISNDTAITFGPASSDWLNAAWVGIHDALTGGNLLSYSKLIPETLVLNGNPLTIPIGNLNVQLAGGCSEYWSHIMLSHIYRNVAAAAPTSLYLALYGDDPGADDSGTELSGNAYARQGITFAAAVGGNVLTDAAIAFPTSTPGDQGAFSHYGIRDAATTGNLISFGAFALSGSIVASSYLQIPAGNLSQVAA